MHGAAIVVQASGEIAYDDNAELRALLVQCVKGVLPSEDAHYILGIDEVGTGGETEQVVVGFAVANSDARAELIVDGIRDSKALPDAAREQAVEAISQSCLRFETIQVPNPGTGQSRAKAAAIATGKTVARWWVEGTLPADIRIYIDQTNEAALLDALGDQRKDIHPRIVMQPKADAEHVIVGAASILAKQASVGKTPEKGGKHAAMGHFYIGSYKESDKDQILKLLHGLERSYPDIGKWIGKEGGPKGVWQKVRKGDLHLTVARLDNEVVGFCLCNNKDKRNAKISTFFVARPYRSRQIGPRIMDNELRRLAKAGISRVMVTFGHEEFHNMQPFFARHGFTVDGISPQRYRDNSYEVIMGKRFKHGTVKEADFPQFVRHDVFLMQGYDVKDVDGGFLATPRTTLLSGMGVTANRLFVASTTSPTPEDEVKATKKLAKSHDASPVLASSYGFPANKTLPPGIQILDALELERMFFPLEIERPDCKDLVIPIKPEFAQQLFPDPKQSTLTIGPLGLRTTNAYYRANKGHKDYRRGSRIFFYQSQGKGIFGCARLESIKEGSPKKLFGSHSGLGAWSVEQIAEHTRGGDGLAYRFSGFTPFPVPVKHETIQQIHTKFNPTTLYPLPSWAGSQVADKGNP